MAVTSNTLDGKAQELRELIREANGTIGDLRREKKEFIKEIDDIIKDHFKGIQEHMDKQVGIGLDEYSKSVNAAIEEATNAVYARFNRMVENLLGESRQIKAQGLPSLEEIIRQQTAISAFHGRVADTKNPV